MKYGMDKNKFINSRAYIIYIGDLHSVGKDKLIQVSLMKNISFKSVAFVKNK